MSDDYVCLRCGHAHLTHTNGCCDFCSCGWNGEPPEYVRVSTYDHLRSPEGAPPAAEQCALFDAAVRAERQRARQWGMSPDYGALFRRGLQCLTLNPIGEEALGILDTTPEQALQTMAIDRPFRGYPVDQAALGRALARLFRAVTRRAGELRTDAGPATPPVMLRSAGELHALRKRGVIPEKFAEGGRCGHHAEVDLAQHGLCPHCFPEAFENAGGDR